MLVNLIILVNLWVFYNWAFVIFLLTSNNITRPWLRYLDCLIQRVTIFTIFVYCLRLLISQGWLILSIIHAIRHIYCVALNSWIFDSLKYNFRWFLCRLLRCVRLLWFSVFCQFWSCKLSILPVTLRSYILTLIQIFIYEWVFSLNDTSFIVICLSMSYINAIWFILLHMICRHPLALRFTWVHTKISTSHFRCHRSIWTILFSL